MLDGMFGGLTFRPSRRLQRCKKVPDFNFSSFSGQALHAVSFQPEHGAESRHVLVGKEDSVRRVGLNSVSSCPAHF